MATCSARVLRPAHVLCCAAQAKALGPLVTSLSVFLKANVGPWVAGPGFGAKAGLQEERVEELLRRVRAADKVLAAGAGVAAAVAP